MSDKTFARSMLNLRLPPFTGHGVKTSTTDFVTPRYSGRFFLSNTLVGKRVNKKIIFSNGAF